MDGWTGPTTFDATGKNEELDRDENIVRSSIAKTMRLLFFEIYIRDV